MKKIFIRAALLITSFGLVVGCASNTQGQNTAIGAVAGAVVGGGGVALASSSGGAIAAGAVVGAIVGGVIGHSMESTDTAQAYTVMEKNPPHKAKHWKNAKTGKHYTFIPTSKHIALKGYSDCRNYRVVMYDNGQKQESAGTACRQPDGSWQTINA